MRGIAGDEDAPGAVAVRDGDAQVPEADMLEGDVELGADRVVQVVGDGTFHFSTPDSVYATAQQYGLPIFTVVLDNRGWQAVKEATLRVYPAGAARQADAFQARLDGRRNGAVRRFEEVGRAFGAHGERVAAPEELEPAIRRCLDAVEAGQAAILTVRIAPL